MCGMSDVLAHAVIAGARLRALAIGHTCCRAMPREQAAVLVLQWCGAEIGVRSPWHALRAGVAPPGAALGGAMCVGMCQAPHTGVARHVV